ncbi:hypothetical protein EG68_08630 [Paragonimus skrjabini miyazakii]|uniref:Uncharacterized protein n=1 Tax=Paragonimus skrjabini miyazakii TaxID=59628 RepID=A0A8S9YIJ4_9TREM|nr:hypothetical protein EG68_08630 [Paragonimus skrjabini miyazakii]
MSPNKTLHAIDLFVNFTEFSYFSEIPGTAPANHPRNSAISEKESIVLGLTALYYGGLVVLGVIGWLRARRRWKQRQRKRLLKVSSHFEIGPNQLHIKYTDEDSM